MATMNFFRKSFKANTYYATIYQLLVVLLFLQLTRALFFIYNRDFFADTTSNELWMAFLGGIRFDLSTALCINMLVIILRILPFDFVYNKTYLQITNWIFYVFNSLGFLCNIMDTPFYKIINMRIQAIHIQEILRDANTLDVLGGHLQTYWYLVFVFVAFIGLFVWASSRVKIHRFETNACRSKTRRLIVPGLLFLLFIGLTLIGIRGHCHDGRPLSVSDAIFYAKKNKDVAIVLNTPFSIIRTLGKDNSIQPLSYFKEPEPLQLINPIHPGKSGDLTKKNVVIIILEGTGNTYLDALNPYREVHKISDYTLAPFLDSLASKSHVLTNAYANARRSSEGITSILGGFPAYDPFVYMLSPYASNEVDAAATLLTKEGYCSRFLCGCNQGSYAFGAMSKAFGYQGFIDRVEYIKAAGNINYDGNWGIFDHAMEKHLIKTIDALPQPFITSWFTLNTHEPYVIPESYQGKYKSPDGSMIQTVEYMDDVMQDFFTEAAKKPWYKNTIFIITADHGRASENNFYNSPNTLFKIPLIIFTPDGSVPAAKNSRIASQIDITPTLLGLLNYNKPFVALGSDLFNDAQPHFAVYTVDGLYQIVEGNFLLQFDGQKNIAMFNHLEDPTLQNNILDAHPQEATLLSNRLKAFLQEYTHRIVNNELAIANLDDEVR